MQAIDEWHPQRTQNVAFYLALFTIEISRNVYTVVPAHCTTILIKLRPMGFIFAQFIILDNEIMQIRTDSTWL